VKLKQEHWFVIAFAIAAILIFLHAQINYQSNASIDIDKSLIDASITSAAFA